MGGEITVEVLEERFNGLERLLTERFNGLERSQKKQSDRMCDEIKAIKARIEDHEDRLDRLERIPWLLGGIATLFSPVAVWAVIQLATWIAQSVGP